MPERHRIGICTLCAPYALLITNQLLYQLSYAGRWRAARGTSATRNRLS